MPYPPGHPRQIPVTKESATARFSHPNGRVDAYDIYTKTTGASPDADIDAQAVDCQIELDCGCYWPAHPVAGVCEECVKEGSSGNVCLQHFAVCTCGAPRCWQHSHATEDLKHRICNRCKIRDANKAMKRATCGFLIGVARRLFSQGEEPDERPEEQDGIADGNLQRES